MDRVRLQVPTCRLFAGEDQSAKDQVYLTTVTTRYLAVPQMCYIMNYKEIDFVFLPGRGVIISFLDGWIFLAFDTFWNNDIFIDWSLGLFYSFYFFTFTFYFTFFFTFILSFINFLSLFFFLLIDLFKVYFLFTPTSFFFLLFFILNICFLYLWLCSLSTRIFIGINRLFT